jgi:hypothetical protein
MLKLEKLGLLGALFRSVYDNTFETDKYNLTVDTSGSPIHNVDLFALGRCISQNDDITAAAIKGIIKYSNNSNAPHLQLVQTTIDVFLDKYKDIKLMLYAFIRYITGSVSLPSTITLNVTNNPNIRILSHNCFFPLDVGTHIDVSTSVSLLSVIENQIKYDTGFGLAGGSRKTRTRTRTRKHKNNNKHAQRKSHKHNKNKIRNRTRNNNMTSKKRR